MERKEDRKKGRITNWPAVTLPRFLVANQPLCSSVYRSIANALFLYYGNEKRIIMAIIINRNVKDNLDLWKFQSQGKGQQKVLCDYWT